MKKKLIVLLVLLTLGTGLYAQQAGTRFFGFRLGGAFGLWAGLEDDRHYIFNGWGYYDFEESNRLNFNFAVYYAYTFRNNLSLQMELNFMVNQGFEEERQRGPHVGEERRTTEITYTSLDIPILLRYSFFHGLLGFLIGPHISIPIAGDFSEDASITFGLTVGGRGTMAVGQRGYIVGEMRFLADFNEVFDDGRRRQALAITLGYEWSF